MGRSWSWRTPRPRRRCSTRSRCTAPRRRASSGWSSSRCSTGTRTASIRTPLLERWGPVDRLTWEFRLRPGTRFHDGGELTAADVVFSLNRILDPQVNSPRRTEFSDIDSIVAVDPLTVRITPEAAVSRSSRPGCPNSA